MRNCDLISFTLFYTDNFFHEEHIFVISSYKNYYISYCLCVGLVQLHLIPLHPTTTIHTAYIQFGYKTIYIEQNFKGMRSPNLS
jgi:hypothetical protein